MNIPPQLTDPRLRFIKLGNRMTEWAKRPVERDYYLKTNYNCFEIKAYIKDDFNYGVITGNMIVIDFDDALYQTIMKKSLPPTFTVKSAGKGLLHFYYWVDVPFETLKINLGKVRIADILGVGNFVVGAGSMNKSRHYEIVNNVPLSKITKASILQIFDKWLTKPEPEEYRPPVRTDKEYYTCWDVLDKSRNHFQVVKNDGEFIRGIDPKYGISEGNKHNFFINRSGQGWYSHHSGQGGSPTDLVAYLLDVEINEALIILREWRMNEI